MSKAKKREKRLLKQYANVPDEELIAQFNKLNKEYYKLIESEYLALNIFSDIEGMVYYAANFNRHLKTDYFKLYKVIILRGLQSQVKTVDEPVTTDDIVKRVQENMYEEMNYLDEYCYQSACFYDDNGWYQTNSILAAELLKIGRDAAARASDVCYSELCESYKEIINYVQYNHILVGILNISQNNMLPVYLCNNKYYLASTDDDNNIINFYPLPEEALSSVDFLSQEKPDIILDEIGIVYYQGDKEPIITNKMGKTVLSKNQPVLIKR